MTNNLSADDVSRLMADPSTENRANTAEKLASQFQSGVLSKSERELAEEIFKVMVKDAQERVRVALSVNLKHATDLSNEVAASLAKDVSDEVALPILQFSEALSETDLIEIITTQSAGRQVAVAGRPDVTENIADALVEDGDQAAVAALVKNEKAILSEKTLDKVVDKYGDDEEIQNPLVHRAKLPVTIAERLVAKVSENLQQYLMKNHDLPESAASDLILQTREKATLSIVSGGAKEEDVEALVAQLIKNGRLTPSIILRALCVGDLAFFESALAGLAKVPVVNARLLIYDEGDLGLQSIYAKAGLPKGIYLAFRSAFDLVMDTASEKSDDDPEVLMRRILERVLTVHQDIVEEYGVENIDYLLTKLSKIDVGDQSN